MTLAILESLHQLGAYTESRKSTILTPALPCGNGFFLLLSMGISVGSAQPAQPVTSTSRLPASSPAGSMQAAPPASRLSSRGAAAGQNHRPGTALPGTTVNPTACLAGKLGTADRHGKEQWDVRGCDLPPGPPDTGKIELNTNIFSGEWRLSESSLLFSWLFILKSITVEVSPLYALTLIKTWCEILLRKTQINFMFTIALWKERKRKREREKQPDFWFWK